MKKKKKEKKVFEIKIVIDGEVKYTSESSQDKLAEVRNQLMIGGLQVLDDTEAVLEWYPPHRIEKVMMTWFRK